MTSTPGTPEKIKEASDFIDEILVNRRQVLVAFSGGPDSTALLCLASERCAANETVVAAAYFDHKLRGELASADEQSHVLRTADRLGVTLHRGAAPDGAIPGYAEERGISIEEAARVYRFRYLRSLMAEFPNTVLLTGHTADDTYETMIQRFFQGSGPSGLKGISRSTGNIARPLLTWTRDDVLAYLEHSGLAYYTDASNDREEFLRNRIRLALLPAVEDIFPGYRHSLDTLSEKMSLMDDLISRELQRGPEWEREEGGDGVPGGHSNPSSMAIADFSAMHRVVRMESVARELNRRMPDSPETYRIPFGAFRDILNPRSYENNRVLFRYRGWKVQCLGDRVFVGPDIVFTGEKGYFTVVREHMTDGWSETVASAGFRIRMVSSADAATELLPVDSISYPLIIRSKRDGDSIRLATSRKKLKALFNDWKVPEHLRLLLPVCEDKHGVVALMGGLFGFKNVYRRGLGTSANGLVFETHDVSEDVIE